MKNQTFFMLFVIAFLAVLNTANAQIYTNGSAYVYTTDRFGIDKSTPLEQLHIEAYGNKCIRLEEDGSGTEYFTLGIDNSGDFNIIRDDNNIAMSILDANGNVGIGTYSPNEKLHVIGNARVAGTIYTNVLRVGSVETLTDAGSDRMGLNANFIPTSTSYRNLGESSRPWHHIYMSGSLVQSSDKRLKSNIKGLDYGLAEVMQLNPVSYDMNDAPGKKRLGLIAQELQSVMNELVSSTEVVTDEKSGTKETVATEYLGVNYVDMIPVLIKAIQEQQALIEAQATRIDQLEGRKDTDNSRLTPQSTGKVFQNNPNPFKNSTRISYELPENTRQAKLIITDMTGKQVAAYTLDNQATGEVSVNANGLSGGTYIYILIADGQPVARNKMVIAR